MLPRSILKRSSPHSTNPAPTAASHGVHFPPSPSLCSTFSAHSPAAYDRSPIVVSRNTCALPERGGRTYNLDDSPTRHTQGSTRTRSMHPRALAVTDLPQLIPDCSSESEESDASPVSMYNTGYNTGYHALERPALSFLPHPHSDGGSPSRRKKSEAGSSPKRKELERIRPFGGFQCTSDSSSPSTDEEYPNRSPSARRKKSSYSPSSPSTFSPFSIHDDGCLGGF